MMTGWLRRVLESGDLKRKVEELEWKVQCLESSSSILHDRCDHNATRIGKLEDKLKLLASATGHVYQQKVEVKEEGYVPVTKAKIGDV